GVEQQPDESTLFPDRKLGVSFFASVGVRRQTTGEALEACRYSISKTEESAFLGALIGFFPRFISGYKSVGTLPALDDHTLINTLLKLGRGDGPSGTGRNQQHCHRKPSAGAHHQAKRQNNDKSAEHGRTRSAPP